MGEPCTGNINFFSSRVQQPYKSSFVMIFPGEHTYRASLYKYQSRFRSWEILQESAYNKGKRTNSKKVMDGSKKV